MEARALDMCLVQAWDLLVLGARDRRHAFHTPMLASVGEGDAPRLRTVVLRDAQPQSWILRFHTDARSPKASEIERRPDVAMCFYEAASGIQVRVLGQARLHADDEVATAAWSSSQAMSRVCYGVEPAPSTPIASASAYRLPVSADEIAAGRAHFVAVVVHVTDLDWLELSAGHNLRAGFRRLGGGAVASQWLSP